MESNQGDLQANVECNDDGSVPEVSVPEAVPEDSVPEAARNPMDEELNWGDIFSLILALALFYVIDIVLAISTPSFVRSLYHGVLALYFRKIFLAISNSARWPSFIFTVLDVTCVWVYVYVISEIVNDVVAYIHYDTAEKPN